MAGASRRTSQAGDQLGQAEQPDPHQQAVFGILSGLLLAWPTSMSRCCGRQPRRRCSSSTTRRSGNWASASSGSLRSCRRSWRTCYCTPSVTTFMSWPPRSPSSTTTATALRRTGRVVSVGLGLLHVPVSHSTGQAICRVFPSAGKTAVTLLLLQSECGPCGRMKGAGTASPACEQEG